jgi:hypothetical protein
MPHAFFGFGIFLAAMGAEPLFYDGPAVEAGLVMAEMMTHSFFLKISKKMFITPD